MNSRRKHLSLRPSPLAALAVLAALAASRADAAGTADPFGTEALAPPPPLLAAPARSGFVPCQPLPSGAVYGVLEVVDQALCRHPQTHEAWASAHAQAAELGVARAAYLPGLDASVAVSRQRTDGDAANPRSASLTLSWLLYDSGARDASLEAARQLLVAAAGTLDATVQTVFLAALQAYYNAQAARAALDAAQESEKASLESLTAAETRYRIGAATPADRLQAKTAWSQAVFDRVKAEGTLRTAQGVLADVMGFDAGTPLALDAIPDAAPGAAFERDVEALIAEARRRRPDLRAAEARFRAAQANIGQARAAGRPTLSLSAGPGWQDNGSISSKGQSIGLTLTLPLFSGYETTYRVRAAEARAEAAHAQREALRQQVALEVWTNYQNLVTATQSIRTAADLLSSAEQSERVALGRYKAGAGAILDVLNAQSALASARVQRIQAALDWSVSRGALARAVGALDHRLLIPADTRGQKTEDRGQ
ncbi:MAG: TolC family protein [Candidatus Accumulibacter sp.]|jgi:TolC family type I secretion outer membrane protein|nr:TolC family protein [Accumulibacter sp.]